MYFCVMLTFSEYLNQLWKINKQDSHRLKSQELPAPSSSLYNNKPRDSIQLPFLWIFPIDCCKMQCVKVLMLITSECVWLEELWGEAQISHQHCDLKKPLHLLSPWAHRCPELLISTLVRKLLSRVKVLWASEHTQPPTWAFCWEKKELAREFLCIGCILIPHGLMKNKAWHFLSFTGGIGRQQHHFWPWYQCPLPLQFRDMCSVHVSEWYMYIDYVNYIHLNNLFLIYVSVQHHVCWYLRSPEEGSRAGFLGSRKSPKVDAGNQYWVFLKNWVISPSQLIHIYK